MVVEYTYTRLASLFGDAAPPLQSTVHVYGIIVDPAPTDATTSTSTSDAEHTVRLADETLAPGQTVLLRVASASAATHAEAHAFCAGRVLRVHRAAVHARSRSTVVLRGRVAEVLAGGARVGRLSWLVFCADTGAVAAASSRQYTLTPRDHERVQQLSLWGAARPSVLEGAPPAARDGAGAGGGVSGAREETVQEPQGALRKGGPGEGPLLSLAQVKPSPRPFSCIVYVCCPFPSLASMLL